MRCSNSEVFLELFTLMDLSLFSCPLLYFLMINPNPFPTVNRSEFSIKQVKEELAELRTQLEVEKQKRTHKEEYEVLSKFINGLPTRLQTQAYHLPAS